MTKQKIEKQFIYESFFPEKNEPKVISRLRRKWIIEHAPKKCLGINAYLTPTEWTNQVFYLMSIKEDKNGKIINAKGEMNASPSIIGLIIWAIWRSLFKKR